MRQIDFSDGYQTSANPAQGTLHLGELESYANDAAFVAALTAAGLSVAAGQVYFNTTDSRIHAYTGSAWTVIGLKAGETFTTATLTTPTITSPTITGTETVANSIITGAQKIGSAGAANSKSVLELDSTTKGMLFPRMTTTQRDAIATPPTGLTVFNTTTNKLNVFNAVNWVGVGSGAGSGGINYSTNPDAETDLSGFAGYKDAADVFPVDGTGSTSDLVLTRSIVAPLRGLASFLITQPNSTNCQGSGYSEDFEIDSADQAKIIRVSMDYNASDDFVASSGQVGSHSSLEFFIYDITNAVLIPMTPNVITAKGANNYSFSGEFQSAYNSVNYRLIWHCPITDAPATGFQFKFDNIKIGPNEIVYGAPVTDSVDYAVTITGTTTAPTKGTIVTDHGQWRQDGDMLEGSYDFQQSSSGTDGSGIYLFSLPPGLVMDPAKTSFDPNVINNQVGTIFGYQGGTFFYGTLCPYDATHLVAFISWAGAAVTGSYLGSSAGALGSSGVQYGLRFRVPIKGWGSNVQLSQGADTRVVAAVAKGSGGSTISLTGGVDPLQWTNVVKDTHGSITTGSGWKYKASVSGFYKFKFQIYISSGTSNDFYVFKNGNSDVIAAVPVGGITQGFYGDFLNAGDEIQFRPQGNCVLDDNVLYNWIFIERTSGPATIAASETVAARYYEQANTNITNASVFAYSNKDFDTHGAYSSGVFKVPVSGIYSVTAAISASGGTTFPSAGDYLQISVAKNTVYNSTNRFLFVASSTSANPMVMVTSLVNCIVGDEISAYTDFTGPGAPATDSGPADNYIEIHKI